MKKKVDLKKITAIAGLAGLSGLLCFLPQTVLAKAKGPCVNCHTMHNSQGGASMTTDGNVHNALTKGDCLGCHTGVTGDGMNIPYVYSDSSEPNYNDGSSDIAGASGNTLAGGNFYWITTAGSYSANDTHGHNVKSLGNPDDTFGDGVSPPGFNDSITTRVDTTLGNNASALTCAGVTGCHGDSSNDNFSAVSGGHHGDDSTIDGSSVASSYRFLLGIIGGEDSNWEYNATASSDHNQYHGIDRTGDESVSDNSTISFLCAECHGNFHTGAGDVGADNSDWGAAWLRHPTDYDMGNPAADGKEYIAYGGNNTWDYQLRAPVGKDMGASVDNTSYTPVSNVFGGTGAASDDAIVLCVSCHRAHGSPYEDLLRWDYSTCEAGGVGSNTADCGCFDCHTTKDDA